MEQVNWDNNQTAVSVAFEAILLFRANRPELRLAWGCSVSVAFEAILLFRGDAALATVAAQRGFSRLRGDSFI